jgi:RNA polymerase sigma-70 factor (ECF subfamily)
VVLALKTLCGFSIEEMASAFLTTPAAIAKRLTRAKQRIREGGIEFEIPPVEEIAKRLDAVLQTLYLLFNEGYKASMGEKLVREDLCFEAIRLTSALAEHPAGDHPKTHALLALMLLNGARLPARLDLDGNILRLEDQDRSQWDQGMIARGMFQIARSAAGNELSEYHLQAAIAACHCSAADYATTDWARILSLYDQLVGFDNSPVAALNRAVAVANVHGPKAGLDAVAAIQERDKLSSYYLLYAVLGEFELRLHHKETAAGHFRQAVKLAELKSEKVFLSNRLRACEPASSQT